MFLYWTSSALALVSVMLHIKKQLPRQMARVIFQRLVKFLFPAVKHAKGFMLEVACLQDSSSVYDVQNVWSQYFALSPQVFYR